MNNKTTEEIQQERIDILKETIEIINSRLLIKEEHIQTLIEKIDVLKHTIEIDKITIQTQEKTISSLKGALDIIKILNNK